MDLRFYTLWAINAPLDDTRLRRQLDQMKACDFDGVVFHPRFYPNVPPYLGDDYLAILSRTILHAQSLGLDFWIYDENGWPSGTVGGQLLKQHPEDAQQWADLVTDQPPDPLAVFNHNGQRFHLARRIGHGINYLNPRLAQHFLAMTHERYRQGLDPRAFEYVSAFFCDEPEFGLGHAFDSLSPLGSIPWTPRLPELFRARYNEDLLPLLPQLFFPLPGHEHTRTRFWELLTDLFCDAFITPLNDWCLHRGKRFTAHVKGEEHPLFQIPTTGSCHQVFRRLALPGIDALERFPSGHFFPRQVASVAQQFGNGDCMAEAFGGAGWGASPEDLERYLTWLIDHGINHLVLHLFQYHLSTHAIHDWPPSHPIHMTWRDAYPELLRRLRAHAAPLRPHADTLVVAPYRGIMRAYEPRELPQTNIHNAATYPDTAAGRLNTDFLQLLDRVHNSGAAYHVSDERTLEQYGTAHAGGLQLGHCMYGRVILADGVSLTPDARALVAPFLTSPAPAVLSTPATPPRFTPRNVEWQVDIESVNTLVLEPESSGDAAWIAHFTAETPMDIVLHFADVAENITVNGTVLGASRAARCVAGDNVVRFRASTAPLAPFVSVEGRFHVRSLTPFTDGPNNTRSTAGPFLLAPVTPANAGDLLSAGYPFCRHSITLRAHLALPSGASALRFPSIHAACAQGIIDDLDRGWCWGTDWLLRLPAPLSAGDHVLQLRLVPSTFNLYGPHHHIDGDIPVVSPAQYEYRKNFADRPDAPLHTRTPEWHFKPLGVGGFVEIADADASCRKQVGF